MCIKRMLFIIMATGMMMLVAGAIPGSAGSEMAEELHPSLASSPQLLGEELQLSPDGNGERYRPAVAYNSTHGEHLVVWHNKWPDGKRDIYARRVSNTGQVLSWFAITTGAGGDGKSRLQPAVAYNATNDEYLVVWMYEASANVYEIWGKIIPWNGPGANAEFRIIQWANRSFWTPRVAWNSLRNEYMVIWNAFNTTVSFPPGVPNDVAGYRISASGSVIDPGFPIIITDSTSPHQADLVYNVAMDEYFVVFVVVHTLATTGNDIYGLRMGWNGAPVNPPGLIHICEIPNNQVAPAVATNGQDRYMVVWQHEYRVTDHDILAREYNVDGSPAGNFLSIEAGSEDATAPDIAARADDWLTVWQEALAGGTGYAIKGYHWGSTPAVPAELFNVANYAFWNNENPAVAHGRPGYLIVYEGDSSTTNRHIYGRLWWPGTVYLPLIQRNAP